jgi:hypothetical protein
LHFALFRNRSATGYAIFFILSTAAALQHAWAHALRRIAVTVRRVRLTATLRDVAISNHRKQRAAAACGDAGSLLFAVDVEQRSTRHAAA